MDELSASRASIAGSSYIGSTLRATLAAKAKAGGKVSTAREHLRRALTLALRSDFQIEPLKRLIDIASLCRAEYVRTGKDDELVGAASAYLTAYAAASAANCYVYMASAINGLARLSEHQASLHEHVPSLRDEQLAEAGLLLEQAVQLAEISEHAGVIAVIVGCLGRCWSSSRIGNCPGLRYCSSLNKNQPMAATDPVTFTVRGAQRIERAVRKIERPGQSLGGDRRPAPPSQTAFWALLTGNDITGLRYTFVRVIPVATNDEADFIIGRDLPLFYEIASEQPEEGFAREANGTRGVPLYSVVQATYIGTDAADLPAFLFTHQVIHANLPIIPHDHRDNFSGGYSFSVYHPGTGIPQQPWRQ